MPYPFLVWARMTVGLALVCAGCGVEAAWIFTGSCPPRLKQSDLLVRHALEPARPARGSWPKKLSRLKRPSLGRKGLHLAVGRASKRAPGRL